MYKDVHRHRLDGLTASGCLREKPTVPQHPKPPNPLDRLVKSLLWCRVSGIWSSGKLFQLHPDLGTYKPYIFNCLTMEPRDRL